MDFHEAAAASMLLSSAQRSSPPPTAARFEYAEALGCSSELDGWCQKWCPAHESNSPLVARRIVPTGFSSGNKGKGTLRWWGCFPQNSLRETFNETTLARGGRHAAARLRFCGTKSLKEKGFFMTREQRLLIRTLRACRDVLEANRQLPVRCVKEG